MTFFGGRIVGEDLSWKEGNRKNRRNAKVFMCFYGGSLAPPMGLRRFPR
jgi:hypothetical protein